MIIFKTFIFLVEEYKGSIVEKLINEYLQKEKINKEDILQIDVFPRGICNTGISINIWFEKKDKGER